MLQLRGYLPEAGWVGLSKFRADRDECGNISACK